MTNEQIQQWARESNMATPLYDYQKEQLQAFATLVRNAALFEAMEACIDQGELQGHDNAMDCYIAIQRLKNDQAN